MFLIIIIYIRINLANGGTDEDVHVFQLSRQYLSC